MTWRRVSDWKQTITLVELQGLPIDGLVTPEEQLRERFPRLASWIAKTELARVEPDLADRLRAAGATTYDVGYHRVSDGLLFAEVARGGRDEVQVDVNSLDLGDLDDFSDEVADTVSNDRVDALLRILSEGRVTERAVILAFHAPPLMSTPGPLDEAELSAIEALDPALLPDVSDEFVLRVSAALAATKPPQLGPSLTPEQRRTHMRKAGAVGSIAAIVGVSGWLWIHPLILVLATPVVVICGVIGSIYAVAIRQERTDVGPR
ncbi:MAG: hypothetical protein QM756_00665 [Polyangiaceae bacterium]